ncbi:MAG: hypothetical protein R3281_08570 [Balneolaceae bacterium]|nr:hypothetical protein [Balneolaceae bacterium]
MDLPFELEIGKSASQFYWALQNHLNHLAADYDLTIEHARMLLIISFSEGCSQQYLADQTYKTKPAEQSEKLQTTTLERYEVRRVSPRAIQTSFSYTGRVLSNRTIRLRRRFRAA